MKIPSRASFRIFALVLAAGCGGIRLEDVKTPRPVPEGRCLAIGFVGGRVAWDDETQGVRRLALSLREAGIRAETFENRRRDVALELVMQALDADGDGVVEDAERDRATLVVYGQSFGGAAVVKLARELQELEIPVALTVQVDSVGRGDGLIPENVRRAANLYQTDGWFLEGEHPIEAADPSKTRILGNWRFDYSRPPGSEISLEGVPWWKRAFRIPHARMDRDPRVWNCVRRLIGDACSTNADDISWRME